MRHATVLALDTIHPWLSDDATDYWSRLACDWEDGQLGGAFIVGEAARLLHGGSVELPTCPACAALLDLALELRGGYQTKED